MDKSFFQQHISQQFNEELEDIVSRVMTMGGLVQQQLESAVSALVEGDQDKAHGVISSDYQINALEVELDEECTHILARRQPTASDLRLVMAVIKTIADLERMGDEAERIGRMALHVLEEDRARAPMQEIAKMGAHVSEMLRGALDAFTRMDAQQAVKVAQQDIQADSQYDAIMRELIRFMKEDPDSIGRVLDIGWSARSLERIGDRARNICEYVVYFVLGKDVRHTSYEQMAEQATGDDR